jgi:hypothetical protein
MVLVSLLTPKALSIKAQGRVAGVADPGGTRDRRDGWLGSQTPVVPGIAGVCDPSHPSWHRLRRELGLP